MTVTDIEQVIQQLKLSHHPEEVYYRETYRSTALVQTAAGKRAASTAIYYLLTANDYSAWHRIASDELWHFYSGQALNIHIFDENSGQLKTHCLGNPLEHSNHNAVFQLVVPAGLWFAAEPTAANHTQAQANTFSLVACTVAPGFEFSEFELADTEALAQKHPQHTAIFRRLGVRKD